MTEKELREPHLGQDPSLHHCCAEDVVCIKECVDEGYRGVCRARGVDAPQNELRGTY